MPSIINSEVVAERAAKIPPEWNQAQKTHSGPYATFSGSTVQYETDTTGGNSGSPTLNGKGELVGLLFDGTYDTIASDYLYDTVRTRSIHVDSRYLLWTMAAVDDAGHLIEEMGVR